MFEQSQDDKIYVNLHQPLQDFRFDAQVAAVFSDMIQRSVPGYLELIQLIGLIAQRYAQADSHVYDLGCSLGAASLSMAQHISHKSCTIIAVDNAPAMIEKCQTTLPQHSPVPLQLHCADILNFPIENASMVVLNFTLQFIKPELRLSLLQRIWQGMRSGAILVLSEKLHFSDNETESWQDVTLTALHHDFKRTKGYSDLEISQKRSAIEKVLLPDTLAIHQQRLFDAGFSEVAQWYQCLNFASILAKKS
ncbi:carboxy-S-adenosyl-L-methionine synthase CmoA [Candidatus Venteria ishoeyi]|uniref:Carboxy-S-adenosyl-L-methionine synthase n=1 Tax=Candidatus Venteria ishoeyi TaxID=1899563 RepID=A0A1H6F904_9GAMM|nr:carboxy-S-adenosyl-L-methionine synthase CmoA [Candidatus Venteria ishoeyi]SEH06607.1 tRNA (cmo5U34)-methyltransferase [Candidatus Venteria ishoeyi]